MRLNLGGDRNLDHIIHAALRGMDHTILDYDVKACSFFAQLVNLVLKKQKNVKNTWRHWYRIIRDLPISQFANSRGQRCG